MTVTTGYPSIQRCHTTSPLYCHPERSEGSEILPKPTIVTDPGLQILRFAPRDRSDKEDFAPALFPVIHLQDVQESAGRTFRDFAPCSQHDPSLLIPSPCQFLRHLSIIYVCMMLFTLESYGAPDH